MAVTVNSNGSSTTLSNCLKIFALPLKMNCGLLYYVYKILIVLFMVILYAGGIYFKLENCAITIIILRYLDLFLSHTTFMLNMVDMVLPLFAKQSIFELLEILDSTKTSRRKTILFHAILNYYFIIIQLIFYSIVMCNHLEFCSVYCLFPHFFSYTLSTIGFFRCFCVLLLLKQRLFEVSENLSKKLAKITATESMSGCVKQMDEILGGIHAYGRCFGIQLALQFVIFESVVVQNVVTLKKVSFHLPLSVYILMMQRAFSSAVSVQVC